MNPTITDLVTRGILEIVPEDTQSAMAWLEDARRHMVAARHITDLDSSGAHTLAYDAARKAAAAALLTHGYRARAVPGSHAGIAEALESMAHNDDERRMLSCLDQLRRDRNRSEYGIRVFGGREIKVAPDNAARIVDVITGWM